MQPDSSRLLSPASLVAQASALLTRAGYEVRRDVDRIGFEPTRAFVAEDDYGAVGVVVYDSWSELSRGWPVAQNSLVDAISLQLDAEDPKTWDGFLVLFAPSAFGPKVRVEANEIRRDTAFVRKLVATADELRTLADVERVLLPLLPLRVAPASSESTIRPSMERGLVLAGADPGHAEAVVSAFEAGTSLIEALSKRVQPK